ncbi:MAG: hypothetical protein P4L55_01725 [Syntrophobacteraceae bacterium]|nr:hypothetical protein [Syntrophobacteraceae bacterium]
MGIPFFQGVFPQLEERIDHLGRIGFGQNVFGQNVFYDLGFGEGQGFLWK